MSYRYDLVSALRQPEPVSIPDPEVIVLDCLPGQGKTSWLIQMMNRATQGELTDALREAIENDTSTLHLPATRFIYVTPTNKEVARIQNSMALPQFFKEPQEVHGRKYYDLIRLVELGHNIVTTHALLKLMDRSIFEALKAAGYTLVIDEALETVREYEDLRAADRKLLFENNFVYVEKHTQRLRWNYDNPKAADYDGRLSFVRPLCDAGNLVFVRNSIVLWTFPSDFLRCFKRVYIATYLFQGSPMAAYLQAEELDYTLYGVAEVPNGYTGDEPRFREWTLVPWQEVDESAVKASLRERIKVYDGKHNAVGARSGKRQPLSSTWYRSASDVDLALVKNAAYNFFFNIVGTRSDVNMWTAFQAVRSKLAGKGYGRGFVENNAKGTNDYRHKRSLAYLQNTFMHPIIAGYLTDRGVEVNQDLYGLSELIQWVFRSAIRVTKPDENGELPSIDVFIPSERMRTLFVMWLEASSTAHLMEQLRAVEPLRATDSPTAIAA